MKKIFPADELARDERFVRVHDGSSASTRRSRHASARARQAAATSSRLTPDRPDAPDAARALMHGIFVGEIQALEGAGRTCWDFETGNGRRPGAVRAEARHGPPVLGRGPPLRDLA